MVSMKNVQTQVIEHGSKVFGVNKYVNSAKKVTTFVTPKDCSTSAGSIIREVESSSGKKQTFIHTKGSTYNVVPRENSPHSDVFKKTKDGTEELNYRDNENFKMWFNPLIDKISTAFNK